MDDYPFRSIQFFKLDAPKNFANFTRKKPVLESLPNKVAGLKVCNFIKKRNSTGDFL